MLFFFIVLQTVIKHKNNMEKQSYAHIVREETAEVNVYAQDMEAITFNYKKDGDALKKVSRFRGRVQVTKRQEKNNWDVYVEPRPKKNKCLFRDSPFKVMKRKNGGALLSMELRECTPESINAELDEMVRKFKAAYLSGSLSLYRENLKNQKS